MVFNPDNNLIYLFGGKTNGSIIYDDVWTYDGSTWTQLTTYGYPKPVRSFFIEDPTSNDPSLVFEPIYDSQRHKIVVYVSYYPGTGSNYNFSFWDLDPATNKWEYIRDISNKYAGGADYDSLNNVTVFFLGSKDVGVTNGAVRETWVYNYSTLESDINGSWQFYRDYFFIENDGTVNISLNYSADKAASAFVGGLSPSFMLKGVVEHDGACDNLNTSYVEVVSSGENVLCDVLHFPQLNDTVRAAIRLQVPSNVNAGEHNSTITFTGRVV